MKELTKILEEIPNGYLNKYSQLEETDDSKIFLPANILSFIKKRYQDMQKPHINHEFGGCLYGRKEEENYIIWGISEAYNNSSRAKANIKINNLKHREKMNETSAEVIGIWHTHNIPQFSVTDIKTAIANKWVFQNIKSNPFDLRIELVAGNNFNNPIPVIYSLSIEGKDNEYLFKRPKIIALNIEDFIKKYNKKQYFILGLL